MMQPLPHNQQPHALWAGLDALIAKEYHPRPLGDILADLFAVPK